MYENRQPVEGVNVSSEHPLRQFFKLVVAAVLLLLLVVIVLHHSGAWLAKRIPFSAEQRVIEHMQIDFGDEPETAAMREYLQTLARRLTSRMPMPEGMDIVVHYDDEDTFNAFATIGGNLMFYRGLLERIPHENALAMLMAHEIAHVLHRDPMAGLGGGVASAAALALLTGNAGTGTAGRVLNQAGVLGNMQFTRQMEREADETGLAAVAALYGHVAGAEALFQAIAEKRKPSHMPPWLERFASTHPLDNDRIAGIRERAEASGWPIEGELTPLPDGFSDWLGADQ